MSDNKISMLSEIFENGKTGEQVEGITIMIDGKLKNMLDIIIEKEGGYNNYSEVIRDIVFAGINQFVEKYKR
ncbi:nickel responsive regulator [compost metagenome]